MIATVLLLALGAIIGVGTMILFAVLLAHLEDLD